jgi:hypothetical protein
LALLPVLFVTIYPEPSWPYNLTPYLFLAALLMGFGYMKWLEFRNPGVLGRGAATIADTPLPADRKVEGNKLF